ncbi:MAG: hypothetical protein JNL62_15255, partial [Bryobacterales bacterium]|nr:hypothetical protein [Bryobacterales bacterium]
SKPLDRVAELRAYRNEAYAREYTDFVERVRTKSPALAEAVAVNLFKLMAIKDEYEVARLLTNQDFERDALHIWDHPISLSY